MLHKLGKSNPFESAHRYKCKKASKSILYINFTWINTPPHTKVLLVLRKSILFQVKCQWYSKEYTIIRFLTRWKGPPFFVLFGILPCIAWQQYNMYFGIVLSPLWIWFAVTLVLISLSFWFKCPIWNCK